MFRKNLNNLTLASDVAGEFFPNISGDTWREDGSFIATLRATLAGRIEASESVQVVTMATTIPVGDIKDSIENTIESSIGFKIKSGIILLLSVGEEETIEALKTKITAGSFKFDEKATYFFRNHMSMAAFVSTDLKSTVIVVRGIDFAKYHLLQTITPRYLPWYFDKLPKDDPLLKIFKSLQESTSDEYEALMFEVAKKYDFRTAKIKVLLKPMNPDIFKTQS